MELLTILLIAISLSFDTFAVSISSGLILKKIDFINASKIAITLAVFQAAMPLIGWILGSSIKDYAESFDHWIAFGILSLLGGKMIYESFSSSPEDRSFNPLDIKVMVGMAIATSIDALVVGFSFALLDYKILLSIGIIGAVTYIVAMLGMLFGKNIGSRLGQRMEMLGGIMLILIGLKILIEHISA
ncbi:MAG: manganese efflux pump MntP family protein [Bacteroidales bacterium]